MRPDPLDRRSPSLSDGLGLERRPHRDEAGLLEVDTKMRTGVPNIYAIGDIAGQPMLAQGFREGLVAAGVTAGQDEEYDAQGPP